MTIMPFTPEVDELTGRPRVTRRRGMFPAGESAAPASCDTCGVAFTRRVKRGRRPRFCSVRCQRVGDSTRRVIRRRLHWIEVLTTSPRRELVPESERRALILEFQADIDELRTGLRRVAPDSPAGEEGPT
jgi:hypothetical protein